MPKVAYKDYVEVLMKRWGLTIEELRAKEIHVLPCSCKAEECSGWRWTTPDYDEDLIGETLVQ